MKKTIELNALTVTKIVAAVVVVAGLAGAVMYEVGYDQAAKAGKPKG